MRICQSNSPLNSTGETYYHPLFHKGDQILSLDFNLHQDLESPLQNYLKTKFDCPLVMILLQIFPIRTNIHYEITLN